MIAGTASAYSDDHYKYSYFIVSPATSVGGNLTITKRTRADFVLRINPSAVTDQLTYSNVYNLTTEWNGISSNVRLSIVDASNGYVPTLIDQININGEDSGGDYSESGDNVKIKFESGETFFYDMDGNPTNPYESDVVYSYIVMNTWDKGSVLYQQFPEAARKSFLHEVGHSLLLSHPAWGNYSGHTYGGFPKAVMSQGFPGDYPFVSSTITEHDKSCLIAKWGI